MTMRLAIAIPLVVACGTHDYTTPTDPSRRWFYDRGTSADGWLPCLRIAAELRVACRGDTACERGVSEHIAFDCYAGSYRGTKQRRSPCEDGPAKADVSVCRTLGLPSATEKQCEAELVFVRGDLCWRGDPTLTGVGP